MSPVNLGEFGGLSCCEKRVFLKSPVREIRTPGAVRGGGG
jgi:hypothetical protein